HQHLDRRAVLHRAAVQRAPGRPARADGGRPDRRRRTVAAPGPGHAPGHPAGRRGGLRARFRIHGQGVRRGDRADRRRARELHPADRHVGVQPVVPGVRLRRRRGAEHRAAADRVRCRAAVHLAEPGVAARRRAMSAATRRRRIGLGLRPRRLAATCASLGALTALVVLLFPLYAVIVASFETNSQLFGASRYSFFPSRFTLSNYRVVLSEQGGHVVSSLIVALGTAALTLAIAVPAAHALARYRFRVTALLAGSLLVAQILPSIVIANSLFLVYHRLHLLNSYLALIIADASYAVPFGILVLRAFMLGLPRDVIAAARVDGATEWQAFSRVVLPMSRSAIITVALFAFLNGWGDFIFALTMLNGNTFEPVT